MENNLHKPLVWGYKYSEKDRFQNNFTWVRGDRPKDLVTILFLPNEGRDPFFVE